MFHIQLKMFSICTVHILYWQLGRYLVAQIFYTFSDLFLYVLSITKKNYTLSVWLWIFSTALNSSSLLYHFGVIIIGTYKCGSIISFWWWLYYKISFLCLFINLKSNLFNILRSKPTIFCFYLHNLFLLPVTLNLSFSLYLITISYKHHIFQVKQCKVLI